MVFQRNIRGKNDHQSHKPGIIFLEIDGLAYKVLKEALDSGFMPTLSKWLENGSHKLTLWETDLSSQTGASQAGIFMVTMKISLIQNGLKNHGPRVRNASCPNLQRAPSHRLTGCSAPVPVRPSNFMGVLEQMTRFLSHTPKSVSLRLAFPGIPVSSKKKHSPYDAQKEDNQAVWWAGFAVHPASFPPFQRGLLGGRRQRVRGAFGAGWSHDDHPGRCHEYRGTWPFPGRDDPPGQSSPDHMYRRQLGGGRL